jgi:hypothetical protein
VATFPGLDVGCSGRSECFVPHCGECLYTWSWRSIGTEEENNKIDIKIIRGKPYITLSCYNEIKFRGNSKVLSKIDVHSQ